MFLPPSSKGVRKNVVLRTTGLRVHFRGVRQLLLGLCVFYFTKQCGTPQVELSPQTFCGKTPPRPYLTSSVGTVNLLGVYISTSHYVTTCHDTWHCAL